MTTKDHASGQCLCGAVSFTVKFPTKEVAHCHCPTCRYWQATAFATWVCVEPAQQATIDAPSGGLRWFSLTPQAQRGFCARCGTPLFFRSTNWPGEIHISRGAFTDPVDREPSAHYHWEQRVPWLEVVDDLPKHHSPGK